MKIRFYISIILLLFIASACNSDANKEIKQEDIKELRIISLVPSNTLEIEQLGLKNNIVGATSYCDITKDNPDLIVGSVVEINEEKILLLKPDIVFASILVKQKSLDILRNNGIRVELLGKVESFDDLCNNYIQLAKLLDKEADAKQFVDASRLKLDSIIARIPKMEIQPQIFFQLGANPIATVLNGTFMNDFITFAKGENVFSDLKSIIVSRESVVLRNPSHIIISSMGNVGEAEMEIWKEYKDMDAVRNDNIFVVELVTTPTVAAFVKHFEIIVNEIYGKQN